MPELILTPQQSAGFDKARRWLDAPAGTVPQVFLWQGFAGTGKTTCARLINEHIGGRARCIAPTWKAASVMSRKGLLGATSIHNLIYDPAGNDKKHIEELRKELTLLENIKEPGEGVLKRMEALTRAIAEADQRGGAPLFSLKLYSDISSCPLVILDEGSMVDIRTAEDLLSFGVRILVLGDPAQLPPIRGLGYFTQGEPDVLLTDVRRNAGPILRLATAIREGRSFQEGHWQTEESTLRIMSVREKDTLKQAALAADQLLCGRNALRQSCNRRHRELLGYDGSPWPQTGERLMCLKNDREQGLMNGTVWTVTEDSRAVAEGELYLRVAPEEGGTEIAVAADTEPFEGDDTKLDWRSNKQQFTWSYAATIHKFQGSEAKKILMFNDWTSKDTWKAWAYTGVTRASEDLTLVMM